MIQIIKSTSFELERFAVNRMYRFETMPYRINRALTINYITQDVFVVTWLLEQDYSPLEEETLSVPMQHHTLCMLQERDYLPEWQQGWHYVGSILFQGRVSKRVRGGSYHFWGSFNKY